MNIDSPYQGYLYSYPHKTAYRPLDPPLTLAEAWAEHDTSALFLYAHVPFCEMRCGFCNLFTTPNPSDDRVAAWEAALARQVDATARALPDATFARFAIGGGTPTWLPAGALARLLDAMEGLGADLRAIPGSVEVSPATATPEKLALLVERGATRISIGVQSFDEDETRAAQRNQARAQVERALADIRATGVPVLNLDLIYGLPHQTPDSWVRSLERALAFAPEELYLYPLYVRPLTGLGRQGTPASDEHRLALYRLGRDLLRDAGYRQCSMRQFRLATAPDEVRDAPVYRCQEDGMVGLGAGARSYTPALHWSSRYAVGGAGVRAVLDRWATADPARVDWGFRLDGTEQRRRWVILSLLAAEGLDPAAYRARFGTDAIYDLPQLDDLVRSGLAAWHDGRLALTELGLERSDAVGPWLVSDAVRARMQAAELR